MRGAELLDRLHGLLARSDLRLKRGVVRVLGDIGDPTSCVVLSKLLETGDPDLEYDVVYALGQVGAPGPEPKLAGVLGNDTAHPTTRAQAAWALGRIAKIAAQGSDPKTSDSKSGDPSSALAATARICVDEAIPDAAAQSPDPQQVLLESVFDTDERVALASLAALVEIDPDGACRRLAALVRGEPLENAPDPQAPAAGHESLRDRQTDPGSVQRASAPERDPRLQEMVAGRDPENSTLAAILARSDREQQVATEVPEPQAVAPRPSIRVMAARLLGGLHDPESQASEALMEAAGAEDTGLRREALVALGRLGEENALSTLCDGLEDPQAEVRLAALDALRECGCADTADARIAKLLDDPDPDVRQRAVRTLGAISSPVVSGRIAGMLDDDDRNVCRAALDVLSTDCAGDAISSRLVELIFKFSAELRYAAAGALRRLNDSAGTSRLLEILNDPAREELHWICIDALAELHADHSTGVEA